MHLTDERFNAILEEFQVKCKNDKNLQQAIRGYVEEHDLELPDNVRYGFGIDFYSVKVNDLPVLIISNPPLLGYVFQETEHTKKYLKARKEAAA